MSNFEAPCLLSEPRKNNRSHHPDILGAIVTQDKQGHLQTIDGFPLNTQKEMVLECFPCVQTHQHKSTKHTTAVVGATCKEMVSSERRQEDAA